MREIKFKAWHGNRMIVWEELLENPDNAFIGILQGNNPAKLMQYTGLKDKNGREIYEGDILELFTKNRKRGVYKIVVEWKRAGFNLKKTENYKIVGNICENTEFLK